MFSYRIIEIYESLVQCKSMHSDLWFYVIVLLAVFLKEDLSESSYMIYFNWRWFKLEMTFLVLWMSWCRSITFSIELDHVLLKKTALISLASKEDDCKNLWKILLRFICYNNVIFSKQKVKMKVVFSTKIWYVSYCMRLYMKFPW